MARDATQGSVPDFLYIGAPRTGSTWLYLNLKKHPDLWVPPCKNISYFHPQFQVYRLRKFAWFWKDALMSSDPGIRTWYTRFFARPLVSDRWYLSLFPQGRIGGEIAEGYCSLEHARVRHVHDVMPNVKTIFVLRNPVERVLSQAKLGLAVRKDRRIEEVSEDEFVAYMDRPSSQARSRYSHTLDLWNSYFSMEQFLILFYEDLLRSPENYLSSICRFLGVRFERDYFRETIGTKVNKSIDGSLPPSVVRHAARTYREEVENLAARFGGAALQWQHEVEEILR
jgi:hypothetical protein